MRGQVVTGRVDLEILKPRERNPETSAIRKQITPARVRIGYARVSTADQNPDLQAVAALERQGTPVPAECLLHLSPLGWEHINLTGDYIWDLQQTTTFQRLRALRRGSLSVQDEPQSEAR